MTHIRTVVKTLFEKFPPQDLSGGPERDQFDRLRSTLTESQEWMATLRRLYQAEQCDELALSLMWITDRLEAEPDRRELGPEEEDVFFRGLRRGLGLPQAGFGDLFGQPAIPAASMDDLSPASEDVASLIAETSPETGPVPIASIAGGGDEAEGTADPDIFGRLMERFLEAVQSGSDDRIPVLARLQASCSAIRSDASSGEEFQRYAELVNDFLGYIDQHQLLDDVRVMNLVTNIQEPYGQWLSTPEGDRAGILDQCHEMHKDFRMMFE
jgi:hypothetical protein